MVDGGEQQEGRHGDVDAEVEEQLRAAIFAGPGRAGEVADRYREGDRAGQQQDRHRLGQVRRADAEVPAPQRDELASILLWDVGVQAPPKRSRDSS